jgi:hypothetical protein
MSEILDTVVAAHGGVRRRSSAARLQATFNYSGGLFDLKGFPGHRQPAVTAEAHRPWVIIEDTGPAGEQWALTPNRAGNRAAGRCGDVRINRSARRLRSPRTTDLWDRLHLTHFLGYATWIYPPTVPLTVRNIRDWLEKPS